MHMLGYLGGDNNTNVARRAKENDLKLAVEFLDKEKMLVVCVMQSGEVMVTFTDTHDEGDTMIMQVVGAVHESVTGELYYIPSDTILQREQPPVVMFTDSRDFSGEDDD